MTAIPWRLVGILVGLVALIAGVGLTVRSCDARHSKAAQSRVDTAQAGAMVNSAGDAVNTVASAGQNAAASEALTRSNEQSIRAAAGANDKVNPASRDATLAALCRRQAYANDPRCHRP